MSNVSKMRLAAACFVLVGIVGIVNTLDNLNSGRYKVDLLLIELGIGWRLFGGDLIMLAWASRAAVLAFWLSMAILIALVFPSDGTREFGLHFRSLRGELPALQSLVLGLISGVQFLIIRRAQHGLTRQDRWQTTVV